MSSLGKIYIYTGSGRGKSMAALGMALKMASEKQKVAVLYFDRCRDVNWNEFIKKASGGLICPFEVDLSLREPNSRRFKADVYQSDIEEAYDGLERAEKISLSGEYDWLVLDEINVALALGMISMEDFLKFLKSKPVYLNLVLTGVNCPECVASLADFVTEMREVKNI